MCTYLKMYILPATKYHECQELGALKVALAKMSLPLLC